MPALYAISDLFVLPSSVEPWGLVVNEAMNLGCAVAVSDQVGSGPDLVSSENGWVYRAGDVEALDAIISDALADRDGLRAKGIASTRRIAQWDIPDTADGFVAGARAALS
jgi:glycosyltransferase involved in cell wall biosynthesis